MKLANPFAAAGKDGASKSTANQPPSEQAGNQPQQLGWRIATFAKDKLDVTPGALTSSTAIWHAYLAWCREGASVPLALNVFLSRFDALTIDVGIGRFQNSANTLYRDLTLRKA